MVPRDAQNGNAIDLSILVCTEVSLSLSLSFVGRFDTRDTNSSVDNRATFQRRFQRKG